MQADVEAEDEKEAQHLRALILTAGIRPENVAEILDMLDKQNEGDPSHAEELDDEEMENYEPFSAEEVDETIAMLRKHGIAVS